MSGAHDRLVLTNANVIDCVSERTMVGGSVVIERGRIHEVLDGTHSADTRNADVIDLEGSYLFAGAALGSSEVLNGVHTRRDPHDAYQMAARVRLAF